MASDRWERVKAIFQGALAQPPEQRLAWLEQACGGDRALLQEAATLLQSLDSAGDFLEQPAQLEPADVEAFAPGTRIGPYRIEHDIGRGGMGVVYLAQDMRLGRRVALKALPHDVAANPELRERLRREARAAATISHPAVATVYALEEIDDHLVIVSEYVDGETLREWVARGPMAPARARAIAMQIVQGLMAAHAAGVVHRDLKPENVLLTASGQVKVVDFGIAHVEGREATRLTRAGAMLGTPAYMAPEQLLGSQVDARADLYAFGVLLSELVTGRHPLSVTAPTPLPDAFAVVVGRCLQPDPAARFASAGELLTAVEAIVIADSTGARIDDESDVGAALRRPAGAGDGGTGRSSATPVGPGLERTDTAATRSPRWWWEFHQAAAALVYWLMVIPVWRARGLLEPPWGRVFFIATLVAVIVAANLRLNLWFTSRFYPTELRWARRRVARWIAIADWTFVLTLVTGGLAIGEERSPIAVLFISVAIGAAVAFLVIERVTARAAFRTSVTPSTE